MMSYVYIRVIQLLQITAHAKKRMRERGISVDEAMRAVMKGQKWTGKPDGCVHAAMGHVEVVFRRDDEGNLVVITVKNR